MGKFSLPQLEEAYFGRGDIMSLPELVAIYYERGNFQLAYYISEIHEKTIGVLSFYKMMAFADMGHVNEAKRLHAERDDWFDLLCDFKVYWRHAARYALYFGKLDIPEWLRYECDKRFDDSIAALLLFLRETPMKDALKTKIFAAAANECPALKKFFRTAEEKKFKLIMSDAVNWRRWDEYNEIIAAAPSELPVRRMYDDDGFCIYSHKPYQTAASMHIMTDGETTLIFDCGCEIKKDFGTAKIPVAKILDELGITKVAASFISHAHMDHYGSIDELGGEPVYMTSYTRNIIAMMSPDARLKNARVAEPHSIIDIDGVKIRFVPNGHILGSVLFDIDWKDKRRVIYSGDFCLSEQQTCRGLELADIVPGERRTDIFITESTYGRRKNMLALQEYEKIFIDICERLLAAKKKIVIPAFAVGRAQETALLLKPMLERMDRKLLIDGLAAEFARYYQGVIGKRIITENISVQLNPHDFTDTVEEYDVIIASSGMMQQGSTSYRYIEELIERDEACVLKVGFIHPYEDMLLSVINRSDMNVRFFDIPLSAHADYASLVKTAEKISPRNIIYVHGTGILPPK